MARLQQRARLAIALAVGLACGAAAWPDAGDQTGHAKLWSWMETKGAFQTGFSIKKPCETCRLGAYASERIEEGDTILKIPFEVIMRLKDADHTGLPAEYARGLLAQMHNDPSHNATWDLFWSTQPAPDAVLAPELWTEELIAMLQCPELETMGRNQRDVAEGIFAGRFEDLPFDHFKHTVPESRVGLDTFKYVAGLIGSRFFLFYRDGQEEKMSPHLVPFVELIGDAADPNAERTDDDEDVVVRALRDIEAGEEITNSYQPGVVHRPDMSLYIYGSVAPAEAPLLAAVDLPSFDIDNPFGRTWLDDSAHDKDNFLCTRGEFERLAARLASLPTTEAEDRALLDGGSVTDWKQRTVLHFRVQRKQALRQTLERLASALGISYGGTAADPVPQHVRDEL